MPLAQLGEKIPTKKILILVSQGRNSYVLIWLTISAELTLSHKSDGSFLGWPKTNFQGRVKCLEANKAMTAGIAFDLICLLHSLLELWIKQHLSVPWAAHLSLCLCLSRTLSPQSELSGQWDEQKTKLLPLMMRFRICHNSPCAGALLKLLKNCYVKSISKVYFQTDKWDDLIHHTATQACARSRAWPCSLQPSESHTTGTAWNRDDSHQVNSRENRTEGCMQRYEGSNRLIFSFKIEDWLLQTGSDQDTGYHPESFCSSPKN